MPRSDLSRFLPDILRRTFAHRPADRKTGAHADSARPSADAGRGRVLDQSEAIRERRFPLPGIPVRISTLTLRQHGIIATLHPDEHRQALERGRWTCCDCGAIMPGCMEVHAVNGDHLDLSEGNLRPICHYCHLVRHPIAAARSASIQPVWWPEASQVEVNRIAWAYMALDELARTRISVNARLMDPLRELDLIIIQRRDRAARICGTPAADRFLEALVEIRQTGGLDVYDRICADRLSAIRFWPRRRIRIWRGSGLVDVTQDVRESFFRPGGLFHDLDVEDLVRRAIARADRIGQEAG